MSTFTISVPDGAHLRALGILRSEWRKFFSVRSTWILSLTALGVMILFALGFGMIFGYVLSRGPEREDAGIQGTGAFVNSTATSGLMIAALLYAAAVVVAIAGEFGSHSALSTFAAVPRRWPSYLAKTVVTGVVGFVSGVLAHVVAAWATALGMSFFGVQVAPGWSDTVRESLITGLYVLVLAWMGLGLGALLRNTAGAVVLLSIFVYLVGSVLQGLSLGLNVDWVTWLANHVPTSALDSLRAGVAEAVSGGTGTAMATWDAWLTIGFWGLVPLLLGAWSHQVRGVR